ncbi:MAG: hypothetical protein AAF665_08710 [Pseudomonadota bacterium]
MTRLATAALILALWSFPAWANAKMTLLVQTLAISEVAQILRAEGLAYAETLHQDMLDGQGGDFWYVQVDRIYDTAAIEEAVRQSLETGMTEAEIEAALAFFGSARGDQIISFENAARRAMSDPDVETEARARFAALRDSPNHVFDRVQRFIEVNDLIERNVSGAMSSHHNFYTGLSDGRFIALDSQEILSLVWSEEGSIREDTQGWLSGFLLLAYEPLPQEDLDAYIDYSETASGRALNAALFDGFGQVYQDISYALGRAIALSADAEEI